MLNKKTLGLGLSLMLVMTSFSLASNEASAITRKGKVPGKPKVLVIERIPVSANRVNVRVIVELPKVQRNVAIQQTEIRFGNRTCRIKKSANVCLFKRLSARDANPYVVRARSKNRNGFGAFSRGIKSPTSFTSRWVRAGYSATGELLPPQRRSNILPAILQTSQNTKWSKFEAIESSGTVSSQTVLSANTSLVRFVTDGLVGLARPDMSSTTSGSGMYAVRSDGLAIDAVVSGNATIQDFFVAPNNRFFVIFRSPIQLQPNDPLCVLAEVDARVGSPVCVDAQLANVHIPNQSSNIEELSPIQFDSFGNIYYSGALYSNTDLCFSNCSSWGRRVLRKKIGNQVIDLGNDFVGISKFLVMPDGAVILSGCTSLTSNCWIRRIGSDQRLSKLFEGQSATFLNRFADGNAYFGINNGSTTISAGVRRYLTQTNALDQKLWIANSHLSKEVPHHTSSSICGPYFDIGQRHGGFCAGSGVLVARTFNFGTSHTFVIVGQQQKSLMQYFPVVDVVNVSLQNITVAVQVDNQLALAGTFADGSNALILYNPFTLQETVLLDQNNDIEIYSMAYVKASRKIMFNGLQFSNNTVVTGEIALP